MNFDPNQNNNGGGDMNSANNYFNRTPEQQPSYTAPLLDEKPPISGKFGTLSLVFGIFGLVCCCCCPFLPLIASILAIVFAVIDNRRFGAFRGIAVAGLVLGILGTLAGAYMAFEYAIVLSFFGDPHFLELYAEAIETGDTAALEQYLEQMLGVSVDMNI